jgi:hypothetical protein
MTVPANNDAPITSEEQASYKEHFPTPSELSLIVTSWLKSYWHAPRQKSKWTEVAVVVLTLGIAIAAFWSAWMFQEQLEIAKQQLVASRNSTERMIRFDQRAWIHIGVVNSQLVTNQPIDVPLVIGVIGKTPARKVNGDLVAQLIKPDEDPDFVYAPGHPRTHMPSFLILPNTDIHLTLNVLRDVPGQKNPSVVLFDREIQAKIEMQELILIIHGRLTYEDIFGVSHWLKFCTTGTPNLRKALSTKCNEYNDVDNNE